MNRTVVIYSSLLAVALVAAYLSWTHEPDERRAAGVVLLDIELDDIQTVSYSTGEDFEITLNPRKDDYGEYVWVAAERTEEPRSSAQTSPHHGHDHDESEGVANGESTPEDDEAEPPAQPVVTKTEFKAGTSLDRTMDTLAPFIALREIEESDADLERFGLDEPKASLSIKTRNEERTYDVGAEGYGHRNVYVRDRDSKKIYLVDGQALRALETGDSRLPERRLVAANPPDIDAVSVRSGGQQVRFEHRNRVDRQKAFWAREGASERDRSAAAWIGKLLRMRTLGYVPLDFDPDSLDERLAVDVEMADGRRSRVVIFEGYDEEGREQWYGRSNLTRGIVKLPMALASDLSTDVATLMAPDGEASDGESNDEEG